MLSARYLANLSDDLVELYSKLEYDIKKDIFKRLNKLQQVTDQSVYQMEIVQQVGGLKNDIQQLIAQYDQKAKVEVQKLYEEAMLKATKSDLRYYPTAKRELSENQTQAVNAAIDRLLEPERINKTYASQSRKYEEIYSSLTRMTATVADATEQSFIKEANNAYMKVSTGAFSWQDAYTTAVKNLANEGVKTVLYTGSGKIVERSIESATRMNILTGINQNASQQTLENAENLGTDLVEVSAHLGARPEHAEWQGQVFCLSGEREFVDGDGRRRIAKDFYKTCRLGEAAGICGINCRHSFYPYFEGMPLEYSKGELSEMKDNKVTLDGKKVTQYEAEQELRLCERNIRHYKSEILGYQETNTADTPQYAQAKIKLGQWQARARKITDDTGIQRHYINEYVGSKDGKQPRGSNNTTNIKIESGTFKGSKVSTYTKYTQSFKESVSIYEPKIVEVTDFIGKVKKETPLNIKKSFKCNPYNDEENCQSCMVAVYARLNGFKVIAKKFDSSNEYMSALAEHPSLAFINKNTGKIPEPIWPKESYHPNFINWCMNNLKENDLYSFACFPKGFTVDGHVLYLQKKGTEIILKDGQENGTEYHGSLLISELSKYKLQTARIFNISECCINKDFADNVLEAEK